MDSFAKESRSRPNAGLAYRYMEYCARLGVAVNAVPYTYNKATLRYEVNTKSLKYILWFFTMFVMISMEAGQITIELIKQGLDDKVTRAEWCLVCFLFLSWAFITLIHVNILLHPHEVVNHLNQNLRMRQWFTDERLPLTSDHKVIRIQMIFCVLQVLAQSLMVTVERNKSHFLYSYIPKEWENPVTVTLWAGYAFYRVLTNVLGSLMQYFTTILHVQTCTQVLQLRRKGQLDDNERLKYYRMVQLLTGRFRESYSKVFIPNGIVFVVTNIILGIYVMVKLHDQMELDKFMTFPPMVAVMLVCIFTYIPKNASVYMMTENEYSNTLRMTVAAGTLEKAFFRVAHNTRNNADWQGSSGGSMHATPAATAISANTIDTLKEVRMVARSCPTVGVPFGNFYFIKRNTTMTIFDFTICNTLSTLITFK